jgi:hypothetical protein
MLLGSVTDLTPSHIRSHVVVGSHGGEVTGRYALGYDVSSLICHDAGIGLEDAGVRALDIFDHVGKPAAAVDHDSARIGDAEDMLTRGIVSRANAHAYALGIHPHSRAADAYKAFQGIDISAVGLAEKPKLDNPFERHELVITASSVASFRTQIILSDSASSLGPADDGLIVVTGSHGGLPGNATGRAAKARPQFAVYNDAGIGIDKAGTSRLFVLDSEGIAAACVDAASARIGEAQSSYDTGILSVINKEAARIGAEVGMSLKDFIRILVNRLARDASK